MNSRSYGFGYLQNRQLSGGDINSSIAQKAEKIDKKVKDKLESWLFEEKLIQKEIDELGQEDPKIQALSKELAVQTAIIHKQINKRNGIKGNELKKQHILESFYHVYVEKDEDETNESTGNFYDKLVISQNNSLLIVWMSIYLISCLTSSYFYAFMAAFENPKSGTFLWWINFGFEIIFLITMTLKFFIEYIPDGSPGPERDLSKIAMRYLKNDFMFDFVCVIPLQSLNLSGYERLFYIIKILRLFIGFKLFNVALIMQKIQLFFKNYTLNKIKKNPQLGEDINSDNNNITLLIKISSSLKILLLVCIILNISYFLGFFWFIFCDLTNQYYNVWGRTPEDIEKNGQLLETFYNQFELGSNEDLTNAVIVVYYAFTSLSTVGFGDYHPKNNIERIVCSFILLFGVAIFSFMMGIFITILDQYQNLNADLDDGDKLSKFFGLQRNFNDKMPLKLEFKERIEQFFDYKWKNDKNQALDEEEEQMLLLQLPEEVQNKIFTGFLYSDFLKTFRDTFTIPRDYKKWLEEKARYSDYFSWNDQDYREFMIRVFMNLEPRFERAGYNLIEANDEINEIFFISKGDCDVGFVCNNENRFVLRFSNKVVIGAFNCTFGKRAFYCYRCFTTCEGYSIRKVSWMSVLSEFPEVATTIKENVKMEYVTKIQSKVERSLKQYVQNMSKRNDYQNISLQVPNESELKQRLQEAFIKNFQKFELNQEFQNYEERIDSLKVRVYSLISQIDLVNSINIKLSQQL
mmetsp:Transcript_10851/g.18162  ORF Transcript_10851/g.18162 Transcript_10851/m.18162 type:complete len:747 (+) Transcript_10851:337-2577(+)